MQLLCTVSSVSADGIGFQKEPPSALRSRLWRVANRVLLSKRAEFRDLRFVLDRIQSADSTPVVFGSILRGWALDGPNAQVRDLDVVVMDGDFDRVVAEFSERIVRRTRFGGLVLRVGAWRVDVWPLQETWAIRAGLLREATIDALLRSTFFNIEALALTVRSGPGSPELVLADFGALAAISDRLLDVNLEANPYPDLCVIRTFLISSSMGFDLAPRLALYVARHAGHVDSERLDRIQIAHYGFSRRQYESFSLWRAKVESHVSSSAVEPFRASEPRESQLSLWDSHDLFRFTMHDSPA